MGFRISNENQIETFIYRFDSVFAIHTFRFHDETLNFIVSAILLLKYFP